MIAEGKTFRNRRIYLDGCSFVKCRFENCTIVYSGQLGMEMVNPEMIDCRWELSGPASEVMKFLSVLYQSGGAGGKRIVEATFDSIRGLKPKAGQPTLN